MREWTLQTMVVGTIALVVAGTPGFGGRALAAAPGGAQAIIFAGGPDAKVATAAIQRLGSSGLRYHLEMAPGFPRLVDSATVAGLRPGFQIAVAGFCPAKDKTARLVRDVLALEFSGTYLRSVTGVDASACPKIIPDICHPRPRDHLEVTSEKYHASIPSISWRFSQVDMSGRRPRTPNFESLFVDLVQGGKCLGSRIYWGEEESRDWEFLMEWNVGQLFELPEQTFVVLGNRGGSHGSVTIVGWACGHIEDLLEIPDESSVDDVAIEPVADSDPPAFTIAGDKVNGTYVLEQCKLVPRKDAAKLK